MNFFLAVLLYEKMSQEFMKKMSGTRNVNLQISLERKAPQEYTVIHMCNWHALTSDMTSVLVYTSWMQMP